MIFFYFYLEFNVGDLYLVWISFEISRCNELIKIIFEIWMLGVVVGFVMLLFKFFFKWNYKVEIWKEYFLISMW